MASFEQSVVEWAKKVNPFGESLRPFLGEGFDLMPIVALSALGFTLMQLLTVPAYRLLMPVFLQTTEQVAVKKAKESKRGPSKSPEDAIKGAHRDTAVRTIALVFSVIISYGALRSYVARPESYRVNPDFGTTPEGMFYCAFSVGYFIWDLPISISYGYGTGFTFHAVSCLIVELIGMRPFNQAVVMSAHLFELSTPFLNMRHLMIGSGKSDSSLFSFCEWTFAGLFFLARILHGYWMSWVFISRVTMDLMRGAESDIVRQKGSSVVPLAVLAMACCASLAVLNMSWFLRILKSTGLLPGGRSPRKAPGAGGKEE